MYSVALKSANKADIWLFPVWLIIHRLVADTLSVQCQGLFSSHDRYSIFNSNSKFLVNNIFHFSRTAQDCPFFPEKIEAFVICCPSVARSILHLNLWISNHTNVLIEYQYHLFVKALWELSSSFRKTFSRSWLYKGQDTKLILNYSFVELCWCRFGRWTATPIWDW